MFYDESTMSTSPRPQHSRQSQTLNRQTSRHFGGMPHQQHQNSMYTVDEHYDTPRFADRGDAGLQDQYDSYGMPMAATWNAGAYNHNNSLAGLGMTNRFKPAPRGRSALPSVRLCLVRIAHTDRPRCGSMLLRPQPLRLSARRV
ncbi:hypothetical protein MRB53_039015 [Persea americana]|nr:hypothetical protein MRB53_039015 [Persea americana]